MLDPPHGLSRERILAEALKAFDARQAEQGVWNTAKRKGRLVKFPVLPSRQPGKLNLTNTEIEDLLT